MPQPSKTPSKPEPKQYRSIQTRRRILAAAAVIFDRHGYEAATMAQILQQAKMTKGALYFHFTSKEELSRAIVAEQFNWMAEGDLTSGSPMQSLIDLTHMFATALREDTLVRAGIRLVVEQSFVRGDARPYLGWIETARGLLEAANTEGWLRAGVDVPGVAEMLVGSFTGIQLTSQVLTGRKDLHQRLVAFWNAMLPGLVIENRLSDLSPAGSRTA
ncbi:TetR family transcriptional regulator [Lentzea sp. NBRC 105346]|uniref:ScbR family autoregulator-binding transcription factor n=1 Tax=Lentzea sp. NBRC 105346 TaxID=3032205 RepID=UPI0024A40A42|nr:ScbR family autoregulator-binding transcription factor [Lentzea sp. NBRC 105346]GLZ32269.1 TetR family transcriptional regulator [Lentzea sp. NBRC 105346]